MNTATQTRRQSLVLVTTAWAWGFEDGAQGHDQQGSQFFRFSDPRWIEYTEGFITGALRKGRYEAAEAAESLRRRVSQ